MKIYNLLPAVLFIFSLQLTGQNGQNCPGYTEQKKIGIVPEGIIEFPAIDINCDLFNPDALIDTIIPPSHGSGKDGVFEYPPEIRSFRDFTLAEEREVYPGADRFYSKHRIMPSPYEKSFLIRPRPDPYSKYYLIIKDPITHRRVN